MTRNPTILVIAAALLALCLVSTGVAFTTTYKYTHPHPCYRKLTSALQVWERGDLEKKALFAATVVTTGCFIFAADNHALAAAGPAPSSFGSSSQLIAPVEIISPFGGGFGGFGFSPFGISPLGGFGFGFGIRATPPVPKPDMDIQRSKAELEAIKEKEAQLEHHIQTLLEKQEEETEPKSK